VIEILLGDDSNIHLFFREAHPVSRLTLLSRLARGHLSIDLFEMSGGLESSNGLVDGVSHQNSHIRSRIVLSLLGELD